MHLRVLPLLLVFASGGLARAQPIVAVGPSPLDRYAVDVWTTDHGLPQNSVNAIAQTPDGYLWIGTSGGLARFDGVRFTLVERRDSAGTHIDRIVALTVGPDSALWIATENGLLRYDQRRFTVWREKDGVPGTVISAVHADRDGTVWLNADGKLVRYVDGVFTVAAATSGTWGIARDSLGILWYARAPHGGLSRSGRDTVALPPDAVSFAFQEPGTRWFFTSGGGLLSSGDVERRWRRDQLAIAAARAIVRDGAGAYWLGGTGLHLFQPGARGRLTWPVRIPERGARYDVRFLFVDREGTLWAGTNGDGLIRVARHRLRVYSERDGLSKDQMTAVIQDQDGRMIFGTNCGGLHVLPIGSETVERFRWPGGGRGPDCPMSLARSAGGALWVGHYGPLYRIRDGLAEIVRTPDGATVGLVHALHEGRDGTMWAGRLRGGLVALRPDGGARRYGRADGMEDETVLFVMDDADGVVWVGTPGGLGRLAGVGAGERFTWFTTADGLPTEHVRAVYQDAEGTHWIGTYGGGLARLKDGRFTAIGEREGLADNVVSSILEDDDGNFWMTGNRGIHRVRRADLAAFADGELRRVRGVLYDRTDGLLSVETNGGFMPAAWRARDGTMWFPTVRGVAMVDPAGPGFRRQPPATAVEDVLVDGAPLANGAEHEIGPGSRRLELHYTGLSLIAPEHIMFRYRLAGFEDDWNLVGTLRQAHYPRLPHGRYLFEVQAANRGGRWGEAAVVPIRVLPLFWETLSFRLLAIIVAAGAAGAAIRHRFVRLRREHQRQQAFARRFIEGQETERKRIAAELHDSVGQGLLVAGNRAVLALRSSALSDEARKHLDEIASVVADTLTETREISHNLRPHELDRLGLAVAVRSAVEQASSSRTKITADVREVDGLLDPEAAINVYRIVQEALSNVMKHANATNARVALTADGDAVRLTIADNGAGFVVAAHSMGFGLSGIAQRVTLLGGRHEVHSAPGSGTTIVVTIPAVQPPETR
ncbi:MAG: two-component regulator propeller domain-containing protein [Gemmatimonadaceae bacterium]